MIITKAFKEIFELDNTDVKLKVLNNYDYKI